MERQMEDRSKKEMHGGTTNSKGPLSDHMKTSYCRNLLNTYINERNLNGVTRSCRR